MLLSVGGGCASPYLLTVGDRVGPVGEKVRLVGKLEYRGVAIWHKGMEDRALAFRVNGQVIGADKTGEEGYAHVKHRFRQAGVHRLEVAYEDEGRRPAEGRANVFIWGKDDPILVADIDGTVEQTRKRYLLALPQDLSPPMPGAAEVLRELSSRFRIVYLTARPSDLILKTREWLSRNRFPLGPVFTWDVDRDPWSQADYKKERIDQLQDDFEHVTIGVGNTEKDHKAYRKRKLFSIILDPHDPPESIDRGVKLPDWRTTRELFARNPDLYEKDFSSKASIVLPVPGR